MQEGGLNVLDTSDIISIAADLALRAGNASKNPTRYSNWLGSDLNGCIRTIGEATPQRLIEVVDLTGGQVLDFGCGAAPHRGLLEAAGLSWTGLDYDESMDPTAVRRSTKLEQQIVKYNGERFPFEDAAFDMVWSYQSLEHVNSAETTFSEIARVLRPGGSFVGSTSFLEAYHARSTFCYTPYGFKLLCERYGMNLERLYPTIDGLSLVLRHLFMSLGVDEADYGNWDKMMKNGGAFFTALAKRAAVTGDHENLAEAMAQICGQFYFIARRRQS